MKSMILSCGAAAILAMSAGAAMATSTALSPGQYSLTMNGGGSSDQQPVSISGTGASRQIDFGGAGSSHSMSVTLSGTSFSGSTSASGYVMSLTGTATSTGGSGTFHVTKGARIGNGTFTIGPRAPSMQRASNSSIFAEAWDDFCAWWGSWMNVGATSGPATPGTGSGSTPGHLAPYHPPG